MCKSRHYSIFWGEWMMKYSANCIGDIIKRFRISHEMTLDSLSDGICTKDHLCAIEHNRNQPSLYLLDQLSKKLNVNLFEYYYNLMSFESIEAYSLSNEIFQFISLYDLDGLSEYIDTHEKDEVFQKGEAKKNLFYGKAVLANELGNYKNSLQICLTLISEEGISVNDLSLKKTLYSHIDLLIVNMTAINYHCLEEYNKASIFYELLYSQLSHILAHPAYELYQNLYFEAKLFLNVSSNLAVLKLISNEFDESEKIITQALSMGQHVKSVHCHCELLFCLCELYYYTNRISEAKQILSDVEVFARYEHKEHLYNEFIHNAKTMYPELFEPNNKFLISKGPHK